MSHILLTRLQTTREAWIEAARSFPPRMGLPAEYLII